MSASYPTETDGGRRAMSVMGPGCAHVFTRPGAEPVALESVINDATESVASESPTMTAGRQVEHALRVGGDPALSRREDRTISAHRPDRKIRRDPMDDRADDAWSAQISGSTCTALHRGATTTRSTVTARKCAGCWQRSSLPPRRPVHRSGLRGGLAPSSCTNSLRCCRRRYSFLSALT
jgi:hypothetical protein